MEHFIAHFDEPVLCDLRQRLRGTRWPESFDDPTWSQGIDATFLRELCAYWSDLYDWRADEARLNRFDQWKSMVEDQTIHFIHRRSSNPDAMPLLILHGWPSSIFEFLDIIDDLADPTRGGPGFHVVCPSLPGFGFSTPVASRGTDARRTADLMVELMRRLGYLQFLGHGGDFGAIILTQMAERTPQSMLGMHLTMAFVPPSENAPLTDRDRAGLERLSRFQRDEYAYSALQKTTPSTLGFALTDSPVGQAAWIVERFRNWSDCHGDVLSVFSMDQLLANVTLYWLTATGGSSARLYYETEQTNSFIAPRSTVPVGYADFEGDTCRLPRSWLEDRLHIITWTTMPRGGHFPAMEVPVELADNIRDFSIKLMSK
jgi:microsomal epoxide hydrolase